MNKLRLLLSIIFIVLFVGTASASFNTTWNTTYLSAGSTNNTSIKLPLESAGTYDFTVLWGDGSNDTVTVYNQANITHNYSSQGEYNIVISGTITGFRFNSGGDKLKITNITNWGDLKLGNSDSYFSGCSNLNIGANDILDTSEITTFVNAFYGCSGLTTLNTSEWNTSKVTTFYRAFRGCSGLTTLDVSKWDTSKVTTFENTFYGCSGLTTLNTSEWNTSKVTTYAYAFSGCSGLTTLNTSEWDTNKVTNCGGIFYSCSGLTTLNTSEWNTSKVTTFYRAFRGCSGLTTLDVSKWDVTSLTNAAEMFYGITLTNTSYNNLLYHWSQQSLQNTVSFHGGGSKYNCGDPATARNDTLIGTYSWTIADGGLDTGDCVYYAIMPNITSSSPSTPTTSFVNESKTFDAGADQLGNWTWCMDSVLVKDYETNTANGTYTNSTALNGTIYNVTAIITNTNGSAQTSWNWTPLQNYVTSNVTYCNGTNATIVCIINVSYYTPGTTQWGFNFSWTNTGQQYDWTYINGTVIQSLTASSTNATLEFMKAPPESTGIYYIQKSSTTSTMIIPANSWGMFNNWTGSMTFAGIAANESNDICYTYYNVTSGLWESYYVGYSWNGDYQLSKDASVIGYFDAQTDITSDIITPSSTELYIGWNMLGVQSSSNQTISVIIADIGANCSDSWYFNSSTGSYSNATSDSIQPNQGFLAYITQNMTWSRSVM